MKESSNNKIDIKFALENTVNSKSFQDLIEMINHAKTCPKCSSKYNSALRSAQEHMLFQFK